MRWPFALSAWDAMTGRAAPAGLSSHQRADSHLLMPNFRAFGGSGTKLSILAAVWRWNTHTQLHNGIEHQGPPGHDRIKGHGELKKKSKFLTAAEVMWTHNAHSEWLRPNWHNSYIMSWVGSKLLCYTHKTAHNAIWHHRTHKVLWGDFLTINV